MEITKAVQRLGWRFQQASKRENLSFTMNKNDIEALRAIDAYVVKKQQEQYQNNELLAKLYIHNFTQLIEHYNTTIFDPLPRRRIHEILTQSLPSLTIKLKNALNDSEKYELMSELGLDSKHPVLRSEQETVYNVGKLQEVMKDAESKKRFLGEVWDFATVADCLEKEINRAINLYE